MIVGAAMAAGCIPGSLDEAPAPDTPRARLDEGVRRFALDAARTQVDVSARVDRGAGAVVARVTVPVRGGAVETRGAGDQLVLEAVAVDLTPIEVPATVVPGGLRLTGIHLGLAAPAPTRDLTWSVDGLAAIGSVPLALDLDWAIDTGGGAYPLARQRLGPIPAVVAIGREGDAITLDLVAAAPGPLWSWAGIVGLGDLSLSLAAREAP